MHPNKVLEVANNPEVPKFGFGTAELAAFHKKRALDQRGRPFDDSGYYVVDHGEFRVLSYWNRGYVTPHSWDVPAAAIECTVEATALAHLTAQGWSIDQLVTTATKDYPTAVGPKRAIVYLNFHDTRGRFCLTAEYQSEGRNVLSTCWGFIRAGEPAGATTAAVDTFLATIERAIADTYAVRLLKNGAAA